MRTRSGGIRIAVGSSLLLHALLLVGARAWMAGGPGDARAGLDEPGSGVRLRVSVRAAPAAEPTDPGLELAGAERTPIPPIDAAEPAIFDDATLDELLDAAPGAAPALAQRPSSGGRRVRSPPGWERGALRRGRGANSAPPVARTEGPLGTAGARGTEIGAGGPAVERPVVPLVPHEKPAPEYPEASRRRGEEGHVVCRIEVGPDGTVTAVEVVESSGAARLDAAAREALSRWRFPPSPAGAVAEPRTLLHTVVFELR